MRRNAAKRAPNGGTTRGGACFSGNGFLREKGGAEAGREENGEGEKARARGVFSNLKPRRGEGTWGERGGRGLAVSNRERGRSGRRFGEERADRRARPVSG